MTPPLGSPVNDVGDTHIVETRHLPTIPTATVLGTAIVTTALPLPSSTPATATGTAHVTRAYTDKSTHEPGKQVTITAEASTERTVHFSVSHLGAEIDSGDATVTNGKVTWTYMTPSENNRGYLVTTTGGDDTHAETAFDASTSWMRFPRRGYLSHFKPTAPDGLTDNITYEPYLFHTPSDYVTKLNQDYHLNAFQYYDWQYRHEQPVAKGDLKNEWPLWYRSTYTSAATINTYVTKADVVGASSLAYSMTYAVNDNYDMDAIKEDWILREDSGSNWQRNFGSQQWVQVPPDTPKPQNHMTVININNQGWRDYITGQYATQKNEFKFTGTHIDTFGQTVKKDASGNKLNLTEGLSALVNETAEKAKGAVGINLSNGTGNNEVIPGSTTYLYTEPWDSNEINAQVASHLQSVRATGTKKPMVTTAYANDYDPTTLYWDAAANEYKHPEITPNNGVRIEAESDQANVSGDVIIVSNDASASGGSYTSGIAKSGDAVIFTVDAGQGGAFTFSPRYSSRQADGANHQAMIDWARRVSRGS